MVEALLAELYIETSFQEGLIIPKFPKSCCVLCFVAVRRLDGAKVGGVKIVVSMDLQGTYVEGAAPKAKGFAGIKLQGDSGQSLHGRALLDAPGDIAEQGFGVRNV